MVIKTRLKIYGQENNFCRRQKSNTGVFGGMLRNCQEQRFLYSKSGGNFCTCDLTCLHLFKRDGSKGT